MAKTLRHSASFLQTFHTAKTAAQRTEESQTATPTDRMDIDPAALAFVKGQRSGERAQQHYLPNGEREIFIKGWRILTGPGLISEAQAKWVVDIAETREGVTEAMVASLAERLTQGFAISAASAFITKYKDLPRRVVVTASMAEAIAPGASTEEIQRAVETVTEDGIYVDPIRGRIFKVQFNKATGDGRKLYAKQLSVEFARALPRKDDLALPEDINWETHKEGLLTLDLSGVDREGLTREWNYVAGLIREIKPQWKLSAEQADTYGALYGSCMRCGRDLTLERSIRNGMGRICAEKSGF